MTVLMAKELVRWSSASASTTVIPLITICRGEGRVTHCSVAAFASDVGEEETRVTEEDESVAITSDLSPTGGEAADEGLPSTSIPTATACSAAQKRAPKRTTEYVSVKGAGEGFKSANSAQRVQEDEAAKQTMLPSFRRACKPTTEKVKEEGRKPSAPTV